MYIDAVMLCTALAFECMKLFLSRFPFLLCCMCVCVESSWHWKGCEYCYHIFRPLGRACQEGSRFFGLANATRRDGRRALPASRQRQSTLLELHSNIGQCVKECPLIEEEEAKHSMQHATRHMHINFAVLDSDSNPAWDGRLSGGWASASAIDCICMQNALFMAKN